MDDANAKSQPTIVDDYDEFGMLKDNANEWDLPWSGRTTVVRSSRAYAPDLSLSYLAWGDDEPQLVFLHGGGQNAHTWDTIVLGLGRPAVAIDLPGHGHSSWRRDRNYGPWANAEALETVLSDLVPRPAAVVGMSLGGATAMRLAAIRPDLVTKAVIVDVTPSVNDPSRALTTAERGSVALIAGPPTYESFDAMAKAAVALSPNRAPGAVRRGVRHNSVQLADGSWRWRYDLFGERPAGTGNWSDFTPLWYDVSRITIPTMLVRGKDSKLVLDQDVDEMQRRIPALRVEVVEGAGHAVQSDRPVELIRLIEDFVFGT
jgi:pimeloyl-ACP methyl ester carboxylesterase